MPTELIGGAIGFLLTLMVLSYLIGDNPFFRVAVYLFVGVAAGYAAAVAWWQVLAPRVVMPLLGGGNPLDKIFPLVALVLGVMLMMKISPRTGRLGTPVVAFMVAVAAAVAIGGAVMGTLIPQTQAAVNVMDLSNSQGILLEKLVYGFLMLVGTITTLVYFHFGARSSPTGPQRSKLVTTLSWIGQIFIAITLGVLFAGVFSASLAALIGRISALSGFIAR
jgi:hypothetical protein